MTKEVQDGNPNNHKFKEYIRGKKKELQIQIKEGLIFIDIDREKTLIFKVGFLLLASKPPKSSWPYSQSL